MFNILLLEDMGVISTSSHPVTITRNTVTDHRRHLAGAISLTTILLLLL
jgi:hypothetical protein